MKDNKEKLPSIPVGYIGNVIYFIEDKYEYTYEEYDKEQKSFKKQCLSSIDINEYEDGELIKL